MFYRPRSLAYIAAPILAMPLAVIPGAEAATGPHVREPGSTVRPAVCDGPSPVYTFRNVSVSSQPTNLKSAYTTGAGTLSYNKVKSSAIGASLSASVSAGAGLVLAKASTSLGVGVPAPRTWQDGFSCSLQVPRGQRRAMQLYQSSRRFTVTKEVLRSPCTYVVSYSNAAANAPRKTRQDEWKLVP